MHLVGFAVLFGAWVAAWVNKSFQLTRLMNWGMLIAFVSGLALAAPWGLPEGFALPYVKISVKLGILLVIAALLGIGLARQRKTNALPPVIFWLVGILTLVNAGIAVLWR